MNEQVIEDLKRLRGYREAHIKMGERLGEGGFHSVDLLAIATLNRSMCLTRGFCDLIERENFVSAAPLLRLQIDNCLRFAASWLVDDVDNFILKVMEGSKISSMKDRRGKAMTDRYLCDRVSENEPMIADVYNHTSAYIHLSEKHFWNAIRAKGENELEMKVTDSDAYVSDDDYLDAIHNFRDTTHVLFRFMEGWVRTKTEPGPRPNPPAFY